MLLTDLPRHLCSPQLPVQRAHKPLQQPAAQLQLHQQQDGRCKSRMSVQSRAAAIEKEQMVSSTPDTLLRTDIDASDSMRGRFEAMIRQAQNNLCKEVEALDGGTFHEDAWTRPGGGGGVSRVLQGGKVWEKAGINVSVVYGSMPAEAYRAATSQNGSSQTSTERVPFFAAGISSVMHPHNPFAPTMHFNYRYFETEEYAGLPGRWWFGGGSDITPSYLIPEDIAHFHSTYKDVCDRHDPEFYPRFKKWADDYFLIKHRNERRGLGGIFFDDMMDRPQEQLLAFSGDCMKAVGQSYLPIVAKRHEQSFTDEHKAWQQLRRGRYVEFNLVYDRGTTFGLKTGGRIESILMSLPLTARWQYDHTPPEGSPEADLLDACMHPREWL